MTLVCVPHRDWIGDLTAPGVAERVELLEWDLSADDVPERAGDIEFLVAPPRPSPKRLDRLASLPSLRHVQLLSAGFDHAVPHLPAGVALANAAGVHDAATAEHAVALMLAAQRHLPDYTLAQREGRWAPTLAPGLADHRVLILGYGHIGAAIARRLAPFEVDLVAVASRPKPGDGLVTRIHGIDDLPDLLPEADIVVVMTPLSDATRHLVGRDALALMKPGALVVNLARGPVVDTEALIDACAAGRVRAALDVTDPEPLPPGHPLFATPGVIVSPHVGGMTAAFRPRAAALVARQVAAFVTGRPLENIVVPA